MAEFHLPDLNIGIDTADEDIKALLKIIKPSWNEENIVIKALTGGFSCNTYLCHQSNLEDAVTVRVSKLFHEMPEQLNNREFEMKVVEMMSDLGIMAKLHAIFKNGYCYKYIIGKPLFNAVENIKDPTVYDISSLPLELIANKMSKIHSMKIEDHDFTKTDFFEKMLMRLEIYPDNPDLGIPDKQDLRDKINEIIPIAESLNAKIGLCHGDPHPGNMVYDENTGQLTFVDWELTYIGYLAFDVGYFLKFLMFGEIVPVPGMPSMSEESRIEKEKEFIGHYLKNLSKLTNNSNEVSPEEFDEFYNHVKFFKLVWCLALITLVAPVFKKLQEMNQDFPMDTKDMMVKLYDIYLQTKEETLKELGLKQNKES